MAPRSPGTCFLASNYPNEELRAAAAAIPKYRVLTDLTGDFNRVIFEYEAQNIGEFEARMKQYMTDEVFREKMKGYTDLYRTGGREILRVW